MRSSLRVSQSNGPSGTPPLPARATGSSGGVSYATQVLACCRVSGLRRAFLTPVALPLLCLRQTAECCNTARLSQKIPPPPPRILQSTVQAVQQVRLGAGRGLPTGRAAPRISRLWFFGVFGCTFGGRTLLTAPVQTDALSILLTLLLFVGLPGTTHPHLRSVEVQTWQLVAVHVQRSQQVWARSSRCSVSSSPITKASKPF